MNGADDGLAFGGELLQQHDALLRGGAVQAAGRWKHASQESFGNVYYLLHSVSLRLF